ncbi:hypothetical protein [Segniliparus rugosus]|nr:hypothetical protein [Segniliparus rugosus]
MTLDLRRGNPAPEILRVVKLPDSENDNSPRRTERKSPTIELLGASQGMVILQKLAQPELVSGGPYDLYVVQSDGSVRPLGQTPLPGVTAYASFRDDGKFFAYAMVQHLDASFRAWSVAVIDTTAWQTETSDIEDAPNPHAVPVINGMWWSPADALEVGYESWDHESPPGEIGLITKPNVYKFAENRWRQVTSDGATWVFDFTPKTAAVLVPTDPNKAFGAANLYLQADGKRWLLSEDASAPSGFVTGD